MNSYEINELNKELHGGNIYLAAGKSGFKEREILDYSTNVNPLGVPENFKQYISGSLDSLAGYPDPYCIRLRNTLAKYLGVDADNIIAGNGAAEIIYLLFEVLKPENVLITAPSFAEYELAAERAECRVHYCNLKEEAEFRISAAEIIGQAEVMRKQNGTEGGRQMIFLCNPNNPTAKVIAPDELFKILDYTDRNDMFLVVDETFIELVHSVPVRSLVKDAARFRNLFVIRAFTKLFALPGLRIGYCVGGSGFITELWKRKLLWSVNSLAASAGDVLLQDSGYLDKTQKWLAEEPAWFYNQLSEIPGIIFYQPETTFILARILNGSFSAAELKQKMLEQGILIRDCSNFKNLDESYFRLAVKDRKMNMAFLKTFRSTVTKLLEASLNKGEK